MKHSLAGAAGLTILPYGARAAAHDGDVFETPAGPVTVHPVSHASFVMETPAGTFWVDPMGELSAYEGLPRPDAILVTHEHGDHYDPALLEEVAGDVPMIVNPAVAGMLPEGLAANATALANGESGTLIGVLVDAVPAYNITEGRLDFHPEGRDNGYVIGLDGFTVYVSGDTEDIPEMRALEGVDLAFVSMNLPFTMDAEAAADAVNAFAPTYVYPYHYRGRDGGTQDPQAFAEMVDEAVEVRMGPWYE
ncbi:MBL fold metallo-hydrolase [Jannaschia seosinensis]|nr:MBL fold metallo-hydrolase [Jannaschia seosinensis]